MVEVNIAVTIGQLQTIAEESLRSRPPSSSRLNTEWNKANVVRRQCHSALDRFVPRRALLPFALLNSPTDTLANAAMPVTASAGQAFLGPGPPSVTRQTYRLAPSLVLYLTVDR